MRNAIVSMTIAAYFSLTACGNSTATPEDALRLWVSDMAEAVEANDRGGMLDLISPAYVDRRNNDYEAIDQKLRLLFLRQQNLIAMNTIDEIRVSAGTAAEIDLTVGLAGMARGSFGLEADVYRFELELTQDEDEWLLIGARWAPMGRDPL